MVSRGRPLLLSVAGYLQRGWVDFEFTFDGPNKRDSDMRRFRRTRRAAKRFGLCTCGCVDVCVCVCVCGGGGGGGGGGGRGERTIL